MRRKGRDRKHDRLGGKEERGRKTEDHSVRTKSNIPSNISPPTIGGKERLAIIKLQLIC